jgi:hypothetical protein
MSTDARRMIGLTLIVVPTGCAQHANAASQFANWESGEKCNCNL